MGMFDSISFNPPDFNMGDDGGGMMKKFLRRKDQDRMRAEQQEQFQSGLLNFRKRQEMDNMSKVMNPQAEQAKTPNVRFAPYNPGLDEFRREQTQLGRDKLNLAKEKQQSQANLADRNLGVKEKLAALKDMPDSEKAKLLQEGRITLQEIRDAEAMKRLEVSGQQRTDQITQQGDIRDKQITQQGDIDMNKITKQGEIGSRYITERGNQARETKTTPPAAGPLAPTQQIAAQKLRANQAIQEHPEWADFIKIDPSTGLVSVTEPADPNKYFNTGRPPADVRTAIMSYLNSSAQAAVPPTQPVQPAPQQPNTGMPTDKYGVMQKTGMFKPGMEEDQPQPQTQPQTQLSSSPDNNSFVTMITPDGKGTRIVPKNQVQTALSQGYKPQGGGK